MYNNLYNKMYLDTSVCENWFLWKQNIIFHRQWTRICHVDDDSIVLPALMVCMRVSGDSLMLTKSSAPTGLFHGSLFMSGNNEFRWILSKIPSLPWHQTEFHGFEDKFQIPWFSMVFHACGNPDYEWKRITFLMMYVKYMKKKDRNLGLIIHAAIFTIVNPTISY